jgi:nucleoside-diphosphate-sugar epimerase
VRKVMITGAAGFVGCALAAQLRADGVEVVGVDLIASPEQGIVSGDISQAGEWQACAAGCDVLIHTAALVSMPTDTSAFWAVNVRGTRLALEAARDHGVGRMVHLSSVVTFGLDFPDQVRESFPVRPTGVAYADTKIAAEQVVLMAHAAGEQQVTVIRPGDIYGPASRPWVVMPVQQIRARRFAVPAMGRGIHSPVFVDDVVGGIIAAADSLDAAGRVITLSGGVGVETRDYFRRLAVAACLKPPPLVPTSVGLAGAAMLDRLARIRKVPNEITPGGVRYLAQRRGTYSIATAAELLGWRPAVDLDAGMELTASWVREQRV